MLKNKFLNNKLILFVSILSLIISSAVISINANWFDPGDGTDLTPPTLYITDPKFSFTTDRSITLKWTAWDEDSGINKYYVKLDGGSWLYKGLLTSHTFNNLALGSRTFSVKAYDNNNNYAIKSKTVSIEIDTTQPTLTIISPNADEIYGTSVTVTWSASDRFGISKYYVKLGEGSWIYKGLATSHTFSGLSKGKKTFHVKAYDNNNNDNTKSVSVEVMESGNYMIQLQSTHLAEWDYNHPWLDSYATATITLNYKVWFNFDESTRRVTYTSFWYRTDVSIYGSFISRTPYPHPLWDHYNTWVYNSIYGNVHTVEEPATIEISGDLSFYRELSGSIESGQYNTGKIYVGLNYKCALVYFNELWELECKQKIDGSFYLPATYSTYMYKYVSTEYRYGLLSSLCTLTAV